MWTREDMDERFAYCALATRLTRKAEIRCVADCELRESRAENDPRVLFEPAEAWKAAFEAKGWRWAARARTCSICARRSA